MAKKILVVEDDPSLRKIYLAILTKAGFEVKGAFDGEDALRVAAEGDPDLILLDMMMPRMTGIEFLRAYDIPGKHPGVKVVAFSNTEKLDFIDEAKKLGAVKYMTKYSHSPTAIIALVNDTLAGK